MPHDMAACAPWCGQARARRAVGRRAVQDDTKEETLSEAYSDTMQKRMGDAKLVYRHEDGMNYTRITDDIIVGSCPQSADDLRQCVSGRVLGEER